MSCSRPLGRAHPTTTYCNSLNVFLNYDINLPNVLWDSDLHLLDVNYTKTPVSGRQDTETLITAGYNTGIRPL